MSVLFIGKRYYTNRDALNERFGRIYQLPWHWANAGIPTRLWLLDYHNTQRASRLDDNLETVSTPVRRPGWLMEWARIMASRASATRPKMVVASGDCYIGLFGWQLARTLGAQFIFDVYDKYDEFSGYRSIPGIDPFGFLLQHSDRRLFASHGLLKSHGQQDAGDFVVPNGVDTQRFHTMNRNECRQLAGIPSDPLLIGYFGSMEPDRGVSDLIAAVRQLRANGHDIECLIGGKPGSDLDLAQPGVRYVGNIPFNQVPTMLASCDALAIPYRLSTFMDAGASNKIAEAMACNRPIVATRTPNFSANFPYQATQLGDALAEPGNVEDIARAILLQLNRRIVVKFPPEMRWSAIASETADQLNLTAVCAPRPEWEK